MGRAIQGLCDGPNKMAPSIQEDERLLHGTCWGAPCLPTSPCGLLVKPAGARHFFKQHAGSIRRQKQPSSNQYPSVLPLGLDDLITSPCWQEPSPLSQGLLLAGRNSPTYAEHSCLHLFPGRPGGNKNNSSHPRGQRAPGTHQGQTDMGTHREVSWKAAEHIWPVIPSAKFWEKRQTSAAES